MTCVPCLPPSGKTDVSRATGSCASAEGPAKATDSSAPIINPQHWQGSLERASLPCLRCGLVFALTGRNMSFLVIEQELLGVDQRPQDVFVGLLLILRLVEM